MLAGYRFLLGGSQTSCPANLRFANELGQFFHRLDQDDPKEMTVTAAILADIHDSDRTVQQANWTWQFRLQPEDVARLDGW